MQTATFTSPAATITPVIFSLATPNPGPDPALIEANVTVANIADPAEPYATSRPTSWTWTTARASWGIPATAAGFRHELPNRYLIYSE